MNDNSFTWLSGGVNQSGVRDHNERLILSVIRAHGSMPGAHIAKLTNLSSQTVSIILRKLENDGLLMRDDPVRGKVGKPLSPVKLNPDGVFAFGLKIGRRSADLAFIDFAGTVRDYKSISYACALPDRILRFLEQGVSDFLSRLDAVSIKRICGIGIATPFELWRWSDPDHPAADKIKSWQNIDLVTEIARFSDLNVFISNDATAACHAEHLYGRGKEFGDYAYFYIGSFIGGGVVMNGAVFEGNQGNAGALGALRTTGPSGEAKQLVDVASIHLLEARLVEAGINPDVLWAHPQDWSAYARYTDPWIGTTAQELAKASLSICSVIDFQTIVIDGAIPADVCHALTDRVRRYLVHQDKRGLIAPTIEAGSIGEQARAIGAAGNPIFRQFFLNTNAGLSRY